jgi:RNA polymerase sigma-70 factor (ECF subfamily)
MHSPDEAVAIAYEIHAPMLRGRFRRATWDDDQAEDLVQEAFARLLVAARAGTMPDNVGGWLYRVGMNAVASQARHAAVERRTAPRLQAAARDGAPSPSPESAAELSETVGRLGVALGALPHDARSAVVLAANGASGEELARLLGRSQGAARTLLCRARMQLRAGLEVA